MKADKSIPVKRSIRRDQLESISVKSIQASSISCVRADSLINRSIAAKCAVVDLNNKIGLVTDQIVSGTLASMDQDGEVINFFPPTEFGLNYTKFVIKPITYMSPSEIMTTVREYTNHVTWYCSKVNLVLAADSPEIQQHADYISKLQYCVRTLANYYPLKEVKVYRGLTCSKTEMTHYTVGKVLYIPSFLSTSRNVNKFYTSDKQNTVMVIHVSKIPSTAFSVNSEYSDFAETEEEALFHSYSKFRVILVENNKVFNNKTYENYMELEHIQEFEGLTCNKNIPMLN